MFEYKVIVIKDESGAGPRPPLEAVLTARLNELAAAGWSLVDVTSGGGFVAVLRRDWQPVPDDEPRPQSGVKIAPADHSEVFEAVDLAAMHILDGLYTDGADHKQWALDQALRALWGKDYDLKAADYQHDTGGGAWDTGIPI